MAAGSLWHHGKRPCGQPTPNNSLVELEGRLDYLVHFVIRDGRLDVPLLTQHVLKDLHESWRGILILTIHHAHLGTAPTFPVPNILGQGHGLQPGEKGWVQVREGVAGDPPSSSKGPWDPLAVPSASRFCCSQGHSTG